MWHRRTAGPSPPGSAEFAHLVFAVAGGAPTLGGAAVELVERSLRATCGELGVTVHAVGVMPDHVHLAISVPHEVDIGDLVDRLKAASSYLLNRAEDDLPEPAFGWRPSYGALVTGTKPRADVVAYVAGQAERHASGDLLALLEEMDDPAPPSAIRRSGRVR